MGKPKLPVRTGLTGKQRDCLEAIEAHVAQTRTMPSLEELRRVLSAGSKAGVLRLLRQLEERGRIARLPHRARAIRLIGRETCPHCGAPLPETARAA